MPSTTDSPPPAAGPIVGSVRDAATPDLSTRFVAILIDGVVATLLGLVLGWLPFIGSMMGALYFVLRDGVEVGPIQFRSVGKAVMGLRPQRMDGRPMDLATSVQRNWMLGLTAAAPIVSALPLLGWMLSPLLWVGAVVFVIVETIRLVRSEDGRRWGDHLAGTKIVSAGDALV